MTAPDHRRRDGVCYARDDTGQLLPVIDVTHDAFALQQTDDELAALTAEFRRQHARLQRQPRWLRRLIYWLFLRKSEFIRNLRGRGGTFLDGMSTYRMKLPAALLDPARVPAIDRKLAAAAPFVLLRLRVQDTARFIADDLAPRLAAHLSQPLHLVNIAGGPTMDSFNALLLLRRRDPALLRNRPVRILLFDQDEAGPAFAARALAALQEPGAPLAGVDVTLSHICYNWDDVAVLRRHLVSLPPGAIVAASSEGGLFNYANDDVVRAQLDALRETLPPDAGVIGSLSPPESLADNVPAGERVALHVRALEPFRALVRTAGWRVDRSVERGAHTVFLLQRA